MKLNLVMFPAIAVVALAFMGMPPMPSAMAHAGTTSNAVIEGPLRVAVTLASARTTAPGVPIVLRYTLVNTSSTETTRIHLGDNKTEWYHLSLTDALGQSARSIPDPHPRIHKQEGLYQTGDRSLTPGDKLQGAIVVTHFLAPLRSGRYTLHLYIPLEYTTKPSAEAANQAIVPSVTHKMAQDFTFSIETTAADPAVVQAAAEDLHQKLMQDNDADRWEPVAEELFSMPEAQALPVWQALVSDPKTPDGVLIQAANQLAYHPTRAAADLLAQMVWNPARPLTGDIPPPESEVAQSIISQAQATLHDIADPGLRQYIRSLYIAHGTPTSQLRGTLTKPHPN